MIFEIKWHGILFLYYGITSNQFSNIFFLKCQFRPPHILFCWSRVASASMCYLFCLFFLLFSDVNLDPISMFTAMTSPPIWSITILLTTPIMPLILVSTSGPLLSLSLSLFSFSVSHVMGMRVGMGKGKGGVGKREMDLTLWIGFIAWFRDYGDRFQGGGP